MNAPSAAGTAPFPPSSAPPAALRFTGKGAGFEAALGEIIERYTGFVGTIVWGICRGRMDRDDAKDILQEGMVTVFTHLDSYSGSGSFEGWARKIFVNTALMHLRRNDALKFSDDISLARSLSDGGDTPLDKIGYRQLMDLIASLPPDARTVFNLHVLEGYSHKEIAAMLGVTEATSRSKLQRARVRLQELIKKMNGNDR